MNHFVIIENAKPYLSVYTDDEAGRAMAAGVLAEYSCDACKAKHAHGGATPKCCRIEQSDVAWSEFRQPRMVVFKDDDEDEEEDDED